MKPMTSCKGGIRPDLRSISKEEAIALSKEDKLEWFSGVKIAHPRIGEVLRQFEAMAERGSGTDIILLVGPTGVGKSTLIHTMWERTMERFQERMVADPGFVPSVVFDGPASGEQTFSWRMLYVRVLEALGDPLIHRKLTVLIKDGRILTRGSSHGTTVAALRRAVEQALAVHKTLFLGIDEAVPILRNRKGDSLELAMDALKSLANICGLTLALIGSYDLLQLAELNGQLARRCSILDFPRYRKGVEDDEIAFRNAVCNLQAHLPIQEKPKLGRLSMQLMDECLGCVGILKDTLSRALTMALQNEGKWTEKILETALLSKTAKTAILKETLEGEDKMRQAAFGSGSYGQVAAIEKSLQMAGSISR